MYFASGARFALALPAVPGLEPAALAGFEEAAAGAGAAEGVSTFDSLII